MDPVACVFVSKCPNGTEAKPKALADEAPAPPPDDTVVIVATVVPAVVVTGGGAIVGVRNLGNFGKMFGGKA